MRMKRLLLSVLTVMAAAALSSCGYNTMQYNEEEVIEAWGNVEAAYQRRADLIPNLVKIVKIYATHERETLTAVTEARAKVGQMKIAGDIMNNPQAFSQFQAAQGEISSALSRLMVVVEKYPDLKANDNYRDLQVQLEGTENRINVARQRYNEAVATFNKSIRGFPNSLTNSLLLHLERKQPFKADENADKAPQVDM